MGKIVLVAGMFGHEFNPEVRMGLACGQMRPTSHNCNQCGKRTWGKDQCTCIDPHPPVCEKMGHNNSWYNSIGEKVGWGDICACDLARVAKEVIPSDTLYCLYEGDGFWNIPKGTNPESPGLPYIQEKTHILVHAGVVYCISRKVEDVGRTFSRGVLPAITYILRTDIPDIVATRE